MEKVMYNDKLISISIARSLVDIVIVSWFTFPVAQVMLYHYLGVPALAGTGILLILACINQCFISRAKNLQV